jgi:hypothetical protein
MTLKSIEQYDDITHILIYANNTTNAAIIKDFID